MLPHARTKTYDAQRAAVSTACVHKTEAWPHDGQNADKSVGKRQQKVVFVAACAIAFPCAAWPQGIDVTVALGRICGLLSRRWTMMSVSIS